MNMGVLCLDVHVGRPRVTATIGGAPVNQHLHTVHAIVDALYSEGVLVELY
jgi:hypothetical protein